jgi:hypothetical protein
MGVSVENKMRKSKKKLARQTYVCVIFKNTANGSFGIFNIFFHNTQKSLTIFCILIWYGFFVLFFGLFLFVAFF